MFLLENIYTVNPSKMYGEDLVVPILFESKLNGW